jgi:hypothetical protein
LDEVLVMEKFGDPAIEGVFAGYPEPERTVLLLIRDLIFQTAGETAGVGLITKTLRWGQPSYITEQTGAGTLVRMDCFEDDKVALLFHCQTTLVETYRKLFPRTFSYSRNRAIVLDPEKLLAADELQTCLAMALTYKLSKRQAKRRG